MPRFAIPVLVASLVSLGTLPSPAAESFRGEGVSLRLEAARPAGDGRFRAALRVDLDPGWKTYWLDPGEAGVPPSFDFGRSTGATKLAVHLPAPHRMDDGVSKSIGYSAPFAIAIEGEAVPSEPGTLDMRVTLGLCRELCIPVAADLSLDLADAGEAPGGVAAAFEDLPRASGPQEGITAMRLASDGKALEVSLAPAFLAQGADLFVAAAGWTFGEPVETRATDGSAAMRLPVLHKPRKGGSAARAEAILVNGSATYRASAAIAGAGG